MSCFRLISIRHFLQRSYFTNTINSFYYMETIQEKSQLADERIQQLKTLISNIGTSKSI